MPPSLPSLSSSPSSLSGSTSGSSLSGSAGRATPPSSPHRAGARRATTGSGLCSSSTSSSPSSLSLSVFESSSPSGDKKDRGRQRVEVVRGGELARSPAPTAAVGALELDATQDDERETGQEEGPGSFKERMGRVQAFAKGRAGVVFLKGGMAVAQIVSLSTILVLSHTTPSPSPITPPVVQAAACPTRYPLQAWLIVHIVRVAVCWPTSCWLLLRRLRVERAQADEEARGESAEVRDVQGGGDSRRGRSRGPSGESASSDQTRVAAPSSPAGPPSSTSDPTEDELTTSPQPLTLARILDLVAPKLSLLCLLTNLVSFTLAHALLPLSAIHASCHHSAPLLWWGIIGAVSVGYGLALEILLVVVVVGVGGWVGKMIHNRRHPTSQPTPPAPGPAPPLEPFLLYQLPLAVYVPSSPSSSSSASEPTLSTPSRQPSTTELRHPPFALPKNQASCPVCLVDFASPKEQEEGRGWVDGEVVRPLKGCGHAFHPGCIDPWLTGTSARCPVCSKVVEVAVSP